MKFHFTTIFYLTDNNLSTGAQGPDIFPSPLAVIFCLSCSCPCVPSLSVSLLLHSATPGSFGSASVSLPLQLPSKGNSTVVVHFFLCSLLSSNPVPSLPSPPPADSNINAPYSEFPSIWLLSLCTDIFQERS